MNYYNEVDPYAAQWLRNLIEAGHIAPGVVDERSIVDVKADDLAGYRQCHFFAGIGVWSYALRLAGWPDDRPVWTGSCPCQPFSAAGKQSGMSDERHLWPVWFNLIRECKPDVVFGEQVEAAIRHGWLDLVQADMEGIGYAFAPVGIPAAGFGAPHIRQRLWFVADADGRADQRGIAQPSERAVAGCNDEVHASELADSQRGAAERHGPELAGATSCVQGETRQQRIRPDIGNGEQSCNVGHAERARLEGFAGHGDGDGRSVPPGSTAEAGEPCGTGPTNGHWRDADWIFCRDGRWRPVSALPQPLVDGSAESLGRVRPETIEEIEREIDASSMESEIRRPETLRALLNALGAQAKRCWPAGGIPGLSEAPFLLAFMRQLSEQGWSVSQGLPLPRPETAPVGMRMLWNDKAATGASCQRGLDGQPPGELADAVHFLSSLLARHASAAWDDAYAAYAEARFPLARGARSRVGRLRAYGNAIVPQVAAEVIASFLDTKYMAQVP